MTNLWFHSLALPNVAFLIILFNTYAYIFTLLFFFLILFTLNMTILKSISNFKNLIDSPYLFNCLVFILLNLAGLPPFVGFVGKLLLMLYLFEYSAYLLILIFFLFNCFVIYFYIQHLKQMIVKTKFYKSERIEIGTFTIVVMHSLFFFLMLTLFSAETSLVLLLPISFM